MRRLWIIFAVIVSGCSEASPLIDRSVTATVSAVSAPPSNYTVTCRYSDETGYSVLEIRDNKNKMTHVVLRVHRGRYDHRTDSMVTLESRKDTK